MDLYGGRMKFSSPFPVNDDWHSYVYDLLFSVQPEKRVYSLVSYYFPAVSHDLVSGFLSSLEGSPILYHDYYYRFRSVYTDIVHDNVLFLSSKRVDRYHEKAVFHLSSLSILLGLSFCRKPSVSRYDGSDLEFTDFNVEFETGLKASYSALEDRIILSSLPVVIVVPNSAVKERYASHFSVWDVSVITLASYSGFVSQFYTKLY